MLKELLQGNSHQSDFLLCEVQSDYKNAEVEVGNWYLCTLDNLLSA